VSEPRASAFQPAFLPQKQAGSNRKLNAGKIGSINNFSYFSGFERFS